MSLLDIGLGLAKLVLTNYDEDGNQLSADPVASPADVRLTYNKRSPYYELASFSQKFVLEPGLEFTIPVSEKTHPQVYSFVRSGLAHDPDSIDAGEVIDSASQTQYFTAHATDNSSTLTGYVSLTVAPTAING